ncbi:MAG: permease [Gammaproteobacteria bacterium]|nr:permease [Gammaproteobacteria bacterium]
MIVFLTDYIQALWAIVLELSPPLLGGLIFAGLIHLIIPAGFIHRTLSKRGLGSVFKSVMVGVPMPLCSCGVVPTALGLRKEGASNGATTAFLISTPQTGVDSILVSANFLGWPFAIFKVISAFATGMLGGLIAEYADEPSKIAEQHSDSFEQTPRTLKEFWHYTVVDLYGAIDKWIYIGVLLAALITALTPDNYFSDLSLAQGFSGMLLMLVISIPLYVCATGSVPIAASLVMAGMPLGTAMIFLMAGPATNVATIGAIYRTLGLKLLLVYLGTLISMSILFALLFEALFSEQIVVAIHQHTNDLLGLFSTIILGMVTLWLFYFRNQQKQIKLQKFMEHDMGITLDVEGMSCGHCVANVKKSLEALDGVELATPDLDSGKVLIDGDNLDNNLLIQAVTDAGYVVKD